MKENKIQNKNNETKIKEEVRTKKQNGITLIALGDYNHSFTYISWCFNAMLTGENRNTYTSTKSKKRN